MINDEKSKIHRQVGNGDNLTGNPQRREAATGQVQEHIGLIAPRLPQKRPNNAEQLAV